MKFAAIAVLAFAVLSSSKAEDDGQYRPEKYGADDGSYRPTHEGRYYGVKDNTYKYYSTVDNNYFKSLIAQNSNYQQVYPTYQHYYVKANTPYQQLLTPLVNYGAESSFDQFPFGSSLSAVTYRPPVLPVVSTVSPVVSSVAPIVSTVSPVVYASTPKPIVYSVPAKPVVYTSTPKPIVYSVPAKPVVYSSTPKPIVYSVPAKPFVYTATAKPVVYPTNPIVFSSTPKPAVFAPKSVSYNYPVYAKAHQYQNEGYARIIKQDNDIDNNAYRYAFETENGIAAEEAGVVDGVNGGGTKVRGFYEYVGDDGLKYRVDYTADENGFHPSGAHLP